MSDLRHTAIERVVRAGMPHAWGAYHLVTNAHAALTAGEGGLAFGGEAARRYRYWTGWAIDELSEGSTGEARTSLVEALHLILEAEHALATTRAAAASLADLTLEALLGWDHHAVRYAALDHAGARVVLKLARPEITPHGQARVVLDPTGAPLTVSPSALLDAEAATLARLDGCAWLLPTLRATGRAADHLAYLTHTRRDGPSLATLIDRREAPPRVCFEEVAEALAQLRHHGVLARHGDLSPDHIFLQDDRLHLSPPLPFGTLAGGGPFHTRLKDAPPEGPDHDRLVLAQLATRAAQARHLASPPDPPTPGSALDADPAYTPPDPTRHDLYGDPATPLPARRPYTGASLEAWADTLAGVPVHDLSDGDLARAVRQRVRLGTIGPHALDRLRDDMLRGDMREGELLCAFDSLRRGELDTCRGLAAATRLTLRDALRLPDLHDALLPADLDTLRHLAAALDDALRAPPARRWHLLIDLRDGRGPATLEVVRSATIGRRLDADILCAAEGVKGRIHATFATTDDGALHLRPNYPTTVNDETIDRPRRLEVGDVVRIGPAVIVIRSHPRQA